MDRIPIALQLYSVRQECAKDLAGTLRAVAQMGYQGVEFAGYHGCDARELRRMLDDDGLRVAGSHTGLDTLLGDAMKATAEFNAEIGNRFLIVPSLPEPRRSSRAAWERTADLFNELAERAAGFGMRVGYHNHSVEFAPLGGECPWDTFFGRTRTEVVMQADIGNALRAGADIIPFIEKYPGRSATVHLKEYSAANDKALIGEGDVDWPRLFDLCENVGGTEWYIVEQETCAMPPLECVRACLRNLRRMGK